jgi:hypothetical protein
MPFPFAIDASEQVRQDLKKLIQEGDERGQGAKTRMSLQLIFHRLHNDPLSFGEPTNYLKHLHLDVPIAVVAPIVVHFAVHAEQELVLLKKVQMLSP